MGSTIYEVLDELRATATSESDKGTRFEKLIKAYLRVDPVFADQFSEVWLWNEYPGNKGKHDTGIDLVATRVVTAGLETTKIVDNLPALAIREDQNPS